MSIPERSRAPRMLAALLLLVVTLLPVSASAAPATTSGTGTDRMSGATRYDVAVSISQRQFPTSFGGSNGSVYVARGDILADAMVGGVLTDGPVLLVRPCGQGNAVVQEEIERLDPARVVALGGTVSVCGDTLSRLAAGRATDRIGGEDRYEVSANIAQEAFPDGGAGEVYLASGADVPDPAAGGVLTAGPILLVRGNGVVPPSVATELGRQDPPRVVALGGTATVSDATLREAAAGRPVDRLAGSDRYAASVAIARYQFPDGGQTVYLARGDIYSDAVTGGVLTDGPVVFVNAARCGVLPESVQTYLQQTQPPNVVALGGTVSVCAETLRAAAAATWVSQSPCAGVVSSMSLEQRVGQLFMVGKSTGTPVDSGYRSMLADTHTGMVVLFGTTSAGTSGVRTLTDSLRSAAPNPAGVDILVAADQEGGLVQRLNGPGFEDIPTATDQGRIPPADLQADAQRWGQQLAAAGVDIDLAPVADVVPADKVSTNEPIGRLSRYYGTTPALAIPPVQAFVRGIDAAGVGTALKHFPGLGHVVGNTDVSAGVVDTDIAMDDPGLAVFTSGVDAGADMVMLATATYALIDPDRPAAFSRTVIEDLLRQDLDFRGVVVADDLGSARQVADVPPGDRALRFLDAGGDVVINVDQSIQRQMFDAVLTRARRDPVFAAEVTTKATRVVELKARHGAAGCSP